MKPNHSDQEIWQAVVLEEDGAFAVLYQAFVDRLYTYGCALTADEDFVKDAIQDIFVRLLERDKRFLSIQNISSYLFVALRNYLVKHAQIHRKRQLLQQVYVNRQPLQVDHAELEIKEENGKLRCFMERELEKLPPRQQEILSLKYFGGFDYEEIGEIMAISNQVARNYACRGVKRLRGRLETARRLVLTAIVAFPCLLVIFF